MDMSQHYLYLSSHDSILEHPGNKASDFIVELNQPLVLQGQWEVAVLEFNSQINSKGLRYVLLMCDFCESSFIVGEWQPLLRKVSLKKRLINPFCPPYYVEIGPKRLERVRIYLKSETLEPLSFDSGSLECTLHLKRVSPRVSQDELGTICMQY